MLPDLETASFDKNKGAFRLPGLQSLKMLRDLRFIDVESASEEL